MSEYWSDRLSDYLDGDLSPAERVACEAHLAECRECAETVEELRALVAQASLLDDPAPQRDLWPGIEARLNPRAAAPAGEASASPPVVSLVTRRRVALTVPQLVAAAVALVMVSAGAVRLMMPTGELDRSVEEGVEIAATAPGAVGPAVPPVQFAGAWEQAIQELETEFQRRRSELDPETTRVVEENLAIINAAIAEANQALAEDPSSAFLNTHLASAMRQKVDLLRRVTAIEQRES